VSRKVGAFLSRIMALNVVRAVVQEMKGRVHKSELIENRRGFSSLGYICFSLFCVLKVKDKVN